jgi:hypothetical protein
MQTSDATAGAVSNLASFLKALAEEGRAVVSPAPLGTEADEAIVVLRQIDELARNELALDAPPFCAASALWAAGLFYHLCQFTVCRDIGEDRITAVCGVAAPAPRGPEVDWSADLTLRHLPKLFQLARHLSNADPLLRSMKQIAAAWPLSSVGIAGLADLRLDSFWGDPALRRLYADRIFSAGDTTRLGETRVDDLVRADLGVHSGLAPAIAAGLVEPAHETH